LVYVSQLIDRSRILPTYDRGSEILLSVPGKVSVPVPYLIFEIPEAQRGMKEGEEDWQENTKDEGENTPNLSIKRTD
jgi:hypothetical protein